MRNKFKEWFSIQLVKKPGRMVLAAILIFNLAFFLLSALIISAMSLDGTEKMNFIEATFCTITMILDAGCIQFVVADIGKSGVFITVFCLFVVLVGMISFTGAVIGYVTNYISDFIGNANAGKHKLNISGHFVILNWNSRASEIINDMLYCDEKQKVVVLVQSRKEEITKEINERLDDTVAKENKILADSLSNYNVLKRRFVFFRKRFKRKVTVIVRQGDIFSSKQLYDISLDKARSVIILGNDSGDRVCKFAKKGLQEEASQGNSQTLKTLMQVSDITSKEDSLDDQKIIVEVTDRGTLDLVNKIILAKEKAGKSNIIPVKVDEVLGQLLSQFCLMPELHIAYSELFSAKGAEFYSIEHEPENEVDFVQEYLSCHNSALPITTRQDNGVTHAYYVANNEKDILKKSSVEQSDYSVNLNSNYWIERKNVVILGHNNRCRDIMAGFVSFSNEWKNTGEEIVRIIVIDDRKNLEKMNYYKEYPFVIKTVEADIFDKDIICSTIDEFVSENEEDTSILILSDDTVVNEEVDANTLANLVYVRDIIGRKIAEDPNFDTESIDVIVEIIDPKHHDIVHSYSVNNVVISNRYISKMITQISEIKALFDFYNDILTYDSETKCFNSKEIYVKKVRRYFSELPKKTTADKFVRAVYDASLDKSVAGFVNPTIVLGYVKPGGKMILFGGDLRQIDVDLDVNDKLIIFASH